MLQHPIPDQERQRDTSLADLWVLLMVTMTVDEEQEIARLVAAGVPAVLRCRLSRLALRQGPDSDWHAEAVSMELN